MEVKILEPITNYIKEFQTPDEFNLWYTKNKAEVDSLTTCKLNKMYKIKGYRITKIKGSLCLKKFIEPVKEMKPILKDELQVEIDNLKNEILLIKESLQNVINVINGSIE